MQELFFFPDGPGARGLLSMNARPIFCGENADRLHNLNFISANINQRLVELNE